jgi:hypothetical protein
MRNPGMRDRETPAARANWGSDKEIWFLNRGVLILRPKDLFVEWVQDADPVVDSRVDATFVRKGTAVCLIPEFDGEEEAWSWIRDNADMLFEHQLNEWYTDPGLWPSKRGWTVFKEWFDLEYVEIAWDLVDAPLSSDAPEVDRTDSN